MGLDIYFFKNGFDIQKSRAEMAATYTKLQVIREELEQLEDDFEEAKLSFLNITHNLNNMAKAVGLYEVLWRPEEIGITTASQMIVPLEKGLDELVANPDKYKAFNPSNRYGSYEDFVNLCYIIVVNIPMRLLKQAHNPVHYLRVFIDNERRFKMNKNN